MTVLGSIHSQGFCTNNITLQVSIWPTSHHHHTSKLFFHCLFLSMPPQKTERQNITLGLDQIARLSLSSSAQHKPSPALLLCSLLLFIYISTICCFPHDPAPNLEWDLFCCMGLSTNNNFHFRTLSLTRSQSLAGSSLLAAQPSCWLKTQKALHLPLLIREYVSESQIKQRGWHRRFIHQAIAAPTIAVSQAVI